MTVMHEVERVGLALQYWTERHLVVGQPSDKDAMDIDSQEEPDLDTKDTQTWSTVFECEAYSGEVYTPARMSEHWIQENAEMNLDGNALHIPDTNFN